MTVYDLLFIFLFLGSLTSLVFAAFLKRARGTRILVALVTIWAVYLAIVTITDVFSSQRVFKLGEDQCFDEMCFAVVDLQMVPAKNFNLSGLSSMLYVVKVRVSSHSRGRTQAEGGLRGRLYERGTYIYPSATASLAYDARYGEGPKLSQTLAPGDSTISVIVFEEPSGMTHPALTLDHGFTPGYFVIGESPFFHEPDIHLLVN